MAFITIKKRTVIAVLSVLLAVVSVAAAASAVITSTRADNGVTVVIDAGHGGADGGVIGAATGTKESDVNLAISNYLAEYFSSSGYNVVRTRSDSASVCGGRYNKREDMRARKNIAVAASPDIIISVHCNSYPVSSVKGAQAFYAANGEDGRSFAEAVQGYFNDVLNDRPRAAAIGDYYILNCTEYPSILVECGFLSNPQEESKLITASYQEKVAYTVFSAVDNMFSERE